MLHTETNSATCHDIKYATAHTASLHGCQQVLHSVETIIAQCHTASAWTTIPPLLLEQVCILLDLEAAALILCDPNDGHAVFELSSVQWEACERAILPPEHDIMAQVLTTRQPYVQHAPSRNLSSGQIVTTGNLCSVVCVPLIASSGTVGVLKVGRSTYMNSADITLLTLFAQIAASAIALSVHRHQCQSSLSTDSRCDVVLLSWLHTLTLQDKDTSAHSLRMSDVTVALAYEMGIQGKDLEHIYQGALLHDIGKLAIPAHILQKHGPLNDEEWHFIRQHPVYAQQMLSTYACFQPGLAIPHFHHEKWDGTGYPHGLRGEAIPLAARIASVVDVWDALRTDRPHRTAWAEDHVRAYLRNKSGTHFDPYVVAVFLGLLAERDNTPTPPLQQPGGLKKSRQFGETLRCCKETRSMCWNGTRILAQYSTYT